MIAAVLIPQVALFGPSIVGRKLLLPLDLLALGKAYLPRTAEFESVVPQDHVLSDLVIVELARRYAASEVRAGRLPLWTPDYFAGAPFCWPKYSPFQLLSYAFPSPVTLAWIQLLKSVVAGVGAFLFFRRILRLAFWPAVIGACCYPVTGFFMLWQGYPNTLVTSWLPWVLLYTDESVRRPRGWGAPALAVLTGLAVLSGQVDTAGHVLLASGIYALWCLFDEHRRRLWSARSLGSAAAVACAWVLGLALSAPHLLPLADYAQSGARISRRAAGSEERPPVGLQALPQTVLPKMYGSTQRGSRLLLGGNLLESAAAAYTGLVATLLLAPLAWCSRRHRSINVLWVVMGFVALAWLLDVPGLVALLRAPVLNMLSHNRFVFVASFAVLAMGTIGLDVIWAGGPERRAWFLLPMVSAAGLGTFCLYRASNLPEPVATKLTLAVRGGHPFPGVPDLPAVWQIQDSFRGYFWEGAVLCGLTVAGWLAIWAGLQRRAWFGPMLGVVVAGDLVWFARGLNPQTDPSLYYPRLPILTRLAVAPPGRVMGVNCLPANLLSSHALRDIRGYDGVDPRRMVAVLDLARDREFSSPQYALTQWYVPAIALTPSGQIKVSGVLSMLNLRYLVFRGVPPSTVVPFAREGDYWAAENPAALPRVYVPRKVETVPDETRTLGLLATGDFDPRRIAYVDQPVSFPDGADGFAEIVDEVPTRVTVSVHMRTPGLLVLADQWDAGWRAELNGRPVAILRTNNVLRGVEVPAGQSRVVFRYAPASFAWGLRLMMGALGTLAVWTGFFRHRVAGGTTPR